MSVSDGEALASDLDINQYSDSTPNPTLRAFKIVFATWEPDYLRSIKRIPSQYRVAMKRRGILAGKRQFIADAFGELQVFLTGNSVRRDCPPKFSRHVHIARAQHSIIQFIYQKQICKSEDRMAVKDFNDSIEVRSAFNIPLNNSEKRPQSRSGPFRLIDPRLIKQTPQVRKVVPVKRRAPKLIECLEPEKLTGQVLIAGRNW